MDEENLTKSTTTSSTPAEEQKGLSVASLVLGIISLVLSCFWYISIPCSILAIVLGAVGMKKGGKGMGIAGIVLGAITIVLAVTLLILAAIGVGILSSVDPNTLNTL